MGIEVDVDAHVVTVDGRNVDLPLRDFDILAVLAANANRIVTISDLAMACWPEIGAPRSLVWTHIRRIRRRIDPGVKGFGRIAVFRDVGYGLLRDQAGVGPSQ